MHDPVAEPVDQRDLFRLGQSARDLRREVLGEPVDLREPRDQILVQPTALRVVVADRGLGDPEGPGDDDLLHLVDLEQFVGESSADRRQESRRGDFGRLQHQRGLCYSYALVREYITVLPRVPRAILFGVRASD